MQCTRTARCTVSVCLILAMFCLLLILWLLNSKSNTALPNSLFWSLEHRPIRSFAIEDDLLFPNQAVVRSPQDFKKIDWFIPLSKFLTQTTSRQITVVEATYDFLPVLLNWLISARVNTQPPLQNILVLAFDRKLHRFLQPFRHVHSVYVNPWSVIKSRFSEDRKYKRRKMSSFTHIWVARLCVFRLLNHWGFDVVHYDADAIVLKNLQPIFDEYRDTDIIGSIGRYPFDLGRKWGQTLCMGMALLRSNERTELFWEGVSTVNTQLFDDQVSFNNVLDECEVTWNNQSTKEAVITGQCTRLKLANCSDGCDEKKLLRVALLPEAIVCRHCNVESKSSYYVWHDQSLRKSEAKKESANSSNVWFLNPRWNFTQVNSLKSLSFL